MGTRGQHLSSYYPYNAYRLGTGVQNYPQFGSINLKCLQRHFELQRPTTPCGTPLGQPADHRTQKNLHLTERVNLELHGDAFNVFNTPQFNNPGSNLDDPTTFGKLTSVKLYTNRQIQLAARLTF